MSLSIPFDDIFRGADGMQVMGGAMGVDKPKVVSGHTIMYLRSICIFTPINAYFRSLRGGAKHLPHLQQVGLILLEDGQVFLIDCDDMISCFNLFLM